MFAYCGNNPIVHVDSTGEIATWVISGLIGTVTSVSCAYIGGERGTELIDDMFWGFLGGSVGVVGKIGALVDAIETGINFGQSSGSALGGIVVGTMSYGVSLFTGSNVSKLNGVLPMDEAAELFFDATFGYAANVFNTLAVDNLETVSRVPASTSNTTQVSRQNSSRSKAANSTYYQNKTADLLGIS